jgi:cyclase
MQTYKNRIFVETQYLGANVSCVKTERGLVLIDSPFLPNDARDWARRIRAETGEEIAFQINTDHHFDHVMGNGFLTDNIICHSTAARGIKFIQDKRELRKIIEGMFPESLNAFDAEIDDLPIPSPLITFKKQMTLDMGDATFVLEFVGGHSPGTILVSLVEDRVAFTGDNVEGQFPYVGQGQFDSWLDTLLRMQSMEIEMVVPGHGAVGGKELIDNYVSFFQTMRDEIKDFNLGGLTPDEMIVKSKAIHCFDDAAPTTEDFPQSWYEEQYKTVVKQLTPGS